MRATRRNPEGDRRRQVDDYAKARAAELGIPYHVFKRDLRRQLSARWGPPNTLVPPGLSPFGSMVALAWIDDDTGQAVAIMGPPAESTGWQRTGGAALADDADKETRAAAFEAWRQAEEQPRQLPPFRGWTIELWSDRIEVRPFRFRIREGRRPLFASGMGGLQPEEGRRIFKTQRSAVIRAKSLARERGLPLMIQSAEGLWRHG